MLKVLILLPLLMLVSACSSLNYYWDSANGHFAMANAARPVSDVLVDETVDDALKQRLRLTQQARSFAVTQLGLPDNGSYTRYANVGRRYVTWNVVATPVNSLAPKQHCFLVVGCLAYRGYFSEQQANDKANEYQQQGLETFVAGAAAYSTLGWFDDPLVNTMFNWSDDDLVAVIFHELAHQKIYIENDSAFNESFATAVQIKGLEQWLKSRNQPERWQRYLKNRAQKQQLNDLIGETRQQLQTLYQQADAQHVLAQKQQIFAAMKMRYDALKQGWQGDSRYDQWMNKPWNNARMALFATYGKWVPAFVTLAEQNGGLTPAFYQQVERIGALEKEQRMVELQAVTKVLN